MTIKGIKAIATTQAPSQTGTLGAALQAALDQAEADTNRRAERERAAKERQAAKLASGLGTLAASRAREAA
jgi:hypothetical protein